jgi:hypothetical protein
MESKTERLQTMSSSELSEHIAEALEEQRRRAAGDGDFDAISEPYFTSGFDRQGVAKTPEILGDLLLCFGSIIEKSSTSHDCVFVHIGEHWVWEHPDVMHDSVRKRPERGREHQRSVTLLPAFEGLEFDVVTSRMRQSAHRMQSSHSYRVSGGKLELISTREVSAQQHR